MLKIVLTAIVSCLLNFSCNTISSTCSDGDVWLHITDANGGDLSACSPLQVYWSTQTISGVNDMPMDGDGEVTEVVFLLSTQSDDNFENDIAIGTSEMDVEVVCNGTTLLSDVVSMVWEATSCESEEVQKASVMVEIFLDQ